LIKLFLKVYNIIINIMATIYEWTLYCNTEACSKKVWSITAPTTCPTNTSHELNPNSIWQSGELSQSLIRIQEETIPTSGNFKTESYRINATASTTSSVLISWPYPISALQMNFVSTPEQMYDKMSLSIGENAIIGALTATVTPNSAWVSQDYTVGQLVSYESKNYECKTNTTTSQVPTNTTYWTYKPLILSVSSTVLQYIQLGYHVNLLNASNGTNNDLGRVVNKDYVNSAISVELASPNTFAYTSPTYVRQTVYMFKDFEICQPWCHSIGESKIGGSYTPANTPIKWSYNNLGTTDKIAIGYVELLY
jgi:hypothetical protein